MTMDSYLVVPGIPDKIFHNLIIEEVKAVFQTTLFLKSRKKENKLDLDLVISKFIKSVSNKSKCLVTSVLQSSGFSTKK
jgi:hypothetical protein